MSNSSAMSLEDRIVQELKEQSLFKLVGDEDAIRDLVKRAITESLYKDRVVGNGYNQTKRETIVMETAREVAEKAAKELVGEMVEFLKTEKAFQGAVMVAVQAALPQAIENFARGIVQNSVETSRITAMQAVQVAAENGMIRAITNNYTK